MKPNDKAIEAAATSLFGNYMGGEKKWIGDALAAAYAAQFQSEDYAGLVERLRDWGAMNYKICNEAADAIEALLAERDALKAELEKSQRRRGRGARMRQTSEKLTRMITALICAKTSPQQSGGENE